MIDLHCLATAINDILGDKYVVWLNTNAEPDESETRTVVTMSAARIPFAYTTEELDAESLTLTLTFDLPVSSAGADLITRDIALNDIHNLLLGWRKIEVEQPSDNPNVPDRYAVTVRFEQQAPANPYTDVGHVKQQIVIGGTALAQNVNCKALVGNFVVVSINDTPLLKVSRVSNTQVGADNNLLLSEAKTLPEMHGISRISTKTLTFLYLGNDIEDEFLKIAEGVEHDVNKIYTYDVSYPNFTISQKFKIAGVSSQDSAGVYLQYTLNVQLVEPAYVVEPPEDDEEGGGNETPPEGGDGGDDGDEEGGDGGGDDTGGSGGGDIMDELPAGTELDENGDIKAIESGSVSGNIYIYSNRNIAAYGFEDCDTLLSVTFVIPGVPGIGNGAFAGCTQLERIRLYCTYDEFMAVYGSNMEGNWLASLEDDVTLEFFADNSTISQITKGELFNQREGF